MRRQLCATRHFLSCSETANEPRSEQWERHEQPQISVGLPIDNARSLFNSITNFLRLHPRYGVYRFSLVMLEGDINLVLPATAQRASGDYILHGLACRNLGGAVSDKLAYFT